MFSLNLNLSLEANHGPVCNLHACKCENLHCTSTENRLLSEGDICVQWMNNKCTFIDFEFFSGMEGVVCFWDSLTGKLNFFLKKHNRHNGLFKKCLKTCLEGTLSSWTLIVFAFNHQFFYNCLFAINCIFRNAFILSSSVNHDAARLHVFILKYN